MAEKGEGSEVDNLEKFADSLRHGVTERFALVLKEPAAREGLKASGRLIANGLITVADFVPGLGEVFSWGADGLKILGRMVPGLKKADFLSPDVGIAPAVATEAFEVLGMVPPTHIVETVLQAKADVKAGKFAAAKDSLAFLMTGKPDYLDALRQNKAGLDQAAQSFEGDFYG